MVFTNLTGVRKKEVDGKFVRTPAAAMRALKDHRVASLASCNGATTVWLDDAGRLRGNFSRWCVTRESVSPKTKVELRKWLDRVWPLCQREAESGS